MPVSNQNAGPWRSIRRVGGVLLLVAALHPGAAASVGTGIPELPVVERPSSQLPSQESFRDWAKFDPEERVFWLQWNDATFQRASAFGRPIFFMLSPGWNRRSQFMFSKVLTEHPIVRELNQKYISILAHPDLRPDLRERYQTGIWPVEILLLPNGDPMVSQANEAGVARPITFAGVERQAIRFLLSEGDVYWQRWASLLYEVGAEWADRERPADAVPGVIDGDTVRDYVAWLLDAADPEGGGFGIVPKRVVPGLHTLSWLQRSRFRPALELHAVRTVDALLASPLHDNRSGGLYRIAIEPGFEGVQSEKLLTIQISWLEELIGLQRTRPNVNWAKEIERTARLILDAYSAPGLPGFSNARVADPLSKDGGGFRRGEHETEPPFEKIVIAGQSAHAAAVVLEAARVLGLEELETRAKKAFDEIFHAATGYGVGSVHSLVPLNRGDRLLWSQADMAWACWKVYELTGDKNALEGVRQLVQFVEANLKIADDTRWVDHLPQGIAHGLMNKPRYPVLPNVRMARVLRRLAIHDNATFLEKRGRAVVTALCGDLSEYRENGIPIAVAVEEYAAAPVIATFHGPREHVNLRSLRATWSQTIWPWSVTRYESKGEPSLTLEWKGKTVTITDPARLDAELKQLTGWISDES